ncbi:MAG: hypothetical protein methR_P0304 [Methyloprofundus sp.]|nr:MAG: hypothetical protein methR_P0304 [Methyloprofundus sp.]
MHLPQNAPENIPNKSKNLPRIEGMESLRSMAALMIIIFHMVVLSNMSIPKFLHDAVISFGYGVPLFYTLSGFVLSYGYINKLNGRNQVINFYIKRYFRIAPLFYFMIPVWIISSKIIYDNSFSLSEIILNYSLLFGLVPGKHESIVWAGWSIGVEILFYLLFPIISALICNIRSSIIAIIMTIFISSAFFISTKTMNMGSYPYMNIITHLPSFLCGMLAFFIWERTNFIRSIKIGATLLIITLVATLAIIYIPFVKGALLVLAEMRMELYIWSFLFTMLILSICFWPNLFIVNKISTGMGKISFSLYLLHPLIIVLLQNTYFKVKESLENEVLSFFACSFLTIAAVTLVAKLSFHLIEVPSMKYGKKIAKL